jgi:hypothetical protein
MGNKMLRQRTLKALERRGTDAEGNPVYVEKYFFITVPMLSKNAAVLASD